MTEAVPGTPGPTTAPGARRGVAVGMVVASVAVAALVWTAMAGSAGREQSPAATRDAGAAIALPGPASTAPAVNRSDAPVVERPARPEGAPTITVASPSAPVGVDIPVVGISSGLQRLGLDADGALEVPGDFDVAGWFAAGPEPGQPGPAVLAGHVDSESGPAVFYRLGELRPGDEVLVRREDGGTIRFTVTAVERYAKDRFPTDSVYGPVPGPELRLITCGGPFDTSAGSYRDNVVVYAVAT